MPRKVADTALAREINALVDRFGSDEKLAAEIGDGATRFAVMRWRVDGTVPEKPIYVSRLVELGIDRELLEGARSDELSSRRLLSQQVARLEAAVVDLTASLEASRIAHKKLMTRVAKLEKAAAAPIQESQPGAESTRRGRSAG